MPKLVAILGSATPPGRMRKALASALDAAPGTLACELVDLGEHRIAWADGRPPEQYGDDTAALVQRVHEADAVVLASPVYRGTYTGVLKNLLDHLPVEALRDKAVGIVAMGATPHHSLGVDWHLRDVLAWFGAVVAPTSVYLTSSDFAEGAPVEAARGELAALLATLLRLCALRAPGGEALGPRPLAARRG
jgi:FMN reductase